MFVANASAMLNERFIAMSMELLTRQEWIITVRMYRRLSKLSISTGRGGWVMRSCFRAHFSCSPSHNYSD